MCRRDLGELALDVLVIEEDRERVTEMRMAKRRRGVPKRGGGLPRDSRNHERGGGSSGFRR
jgi:hypothetical protein